MPASEQEARGARRWVGASLLAALLVGAGAALLAPPVPSHPVLEAPPPPASTPPPQAPPPEAPAEQHPPKGRFLFWLLTRP